MRALLRFAAAAALAAAITGRAHAGSACGSLITNTATVTMWSGPVDQIGFVLTYNVTAVVQVLCPVVSMVKYANRDMASVGSTVTFFICIVNDRNDSIWNVTITDRLPRNMGFWDWNTANYNATTGGPWTVNQAYSTAGLGGPWNRAVAPNQGQGADLWMRWRIQMIGPARSACMTYRATVL